MSVSWTGVNSTSIGKSSRTGPGLVSISLRLVRLRECNKTMNDLSARDTYQAPQPTQSSQPTKQSAAHPQDSSPGARTWSAASKQQPGRQSPGASCSPRLAAAATTSCKVWASGLPALLRGRGCHWRIYTFSLSPTNYQQGTLFKEKIGNTPTVSRDETNTKLLRDLCVALGCLHSGGFVARIDQPDPGGLAAH